MPVQINELVIRAHIVENEDAPREANQSQTAELNKEEIIRECAALVMEIINNKNQR